jgi:hypothetical protein
VLTHVVGEGPYNTQCGDNDCHYLVVDTVNNKLYENYATVIDTNAKTVQGACAVVWDLCQQYPDNLRGDQCTRYSSYTFKLHSFITNFNDSTDAAGFPIAPFLVTADELAAGEIPHALRFIIPNQAIKEGFYIHPATHAGIITLLFLHYQTLQ